MTCLRHPGKQKFVSSNVDKKINSTLFCAVFLRRKNTELQVSGRCRQSDLSVLQWTAQSRLQFLTCKILKQSQCGVSQIFLQQPCWEILSLKRSKFGQPTKIVHDSCSYSGVMTPPEPALKMINLGLWLNPYSVYLASGYNKCSVIFNALL